MRLFARISARLNAAIFAVACIATVTTHAQTQDFAARVNVPFAFETASGAHFQPGMYEVRSVNSDFLLLRSAKCFGLLMIWQNEPKTAPVSHGKAVFTHRGDKYYLRAMSVAGNANELVFHASKDEPKAEIASKTKIQTIELAMLSAGR